MNTLEPFHDWDDMVELDARVNIFSEDAPADYLYVIVSGEVELKRRGESLGVEKAGGIIGMLALIPGATRSATAETLTPVILARLDREQLEKVVQRNAHFSMHVMEVLANRLRAVNKFVKDRM